MRVHRSDVTASGARRHPPLHPHLVKGLLQQSYEILTGIKLSDAAARAHAATIMFMVNEAA